MKRIAYYLIFLFAGLFFGNRIYNHINAWLGVLAIAAVIIFFIYKTIKHLKNEKIF